MKAMNRFEKAEGAGMDGKSRSMGPLWAAGLAVAVVAGAGLMMLPGDAETSTIELGVSQPPLVTIIFDTSGSMNWTQEGDNAYPRWLHGSTEDNQIASWSPGQALNLPGSARRDPSAPGGYSEVEYHKDDRVDYVGPCMVWHPGDGKNSHMCEEYHRPTHVPCQAQESSKDDYCNNGEYDGVLNDSDAHRGVRRRLKTARQDTRFRLSSDANTPRHIQVKQILTGDMYMEDDNRNIIDGPGCWFVPRMRHVYANEQVCCSEIDDEDGCVGDGIEAFSKFVDAGDPTPHIQEVYDGQHATGILDRMGSTAIFSVAMFDPYADDGVRSGGWRFPTTDIMAGDSPYQGVSFDWQSADPDWQNSSCSTEDDAACHNMGLFRFIGPANFDLDEGDMMRVSRYVQQAILDTGFLVHHDSVTDAEALGSSGLEDQEGQTGSIDTFTYPKHQTAIGESTPFGPAFHDLHQFYVSGQYDGLDDGTEDSSATARNPFTTNEEDPDYDPYLSCRGRHVVMFTDGVPEPEAPGGAGAGAGHPDGLGSDRVIDPSQAFGYEAGRFPYFTAEEAIERMIAHVRTIMEANTDGDVDPRHFPKVHILGVGITETDTDNLDSSENLYRAQVLDKVAHMAQAGETCAQYYLPADMLPAYDNQGREVRNGRGERGSCEPDTDVCLMPQDHPSYYGGYPYNPPDNPDVNSWDCYHPAVVLNRADRAALIRAFQLIFNEIAGTSGLASRSRPAMTSYLDDGDRIGQYRFYSGLEARGDNPHYRGLLQRQLLECTASGDIEVDDAEDPLAVHEDMIRLLGTTGLTEDDLEDVITSTNRTDRRRVFTSIPEFLPRFVGEDPGNDMALLGGDNTSDGDLFSTTYRLEAAFNNNDQFGNFKIAGVNSSQYPASQVNTRVPFDTGNLYDTLDDVIGVSSSEFDDLFYQYWRISDDLDPDRDREDYFRDMVDDYRARTNYRRDRVLGAIYNSDPAVVGPPDLELPIESYREFRRNYAERPTMLYVSTVDGQLRAIHTGEPDVIVKATLDDEYTQDTSTGSGPASDQREAWAYIPALIHRNLAASAFGTSTDGLMDGTPVVRDVRLCQRGEAYSSNLRACPSNSTASQWRTVLVQGMGLAGSGYFALDITRSGATDDANDPQMPDPIVLWEFGPDWEALQMQNMPSWRYRNPGEDYAEEMDPEEECAGRLDNLVGSLDGGLLGGDGPADIWELPFLGTTVGEPAVGSVNMTVNSRAVQRPIALVGAGTSAGANPMMPFTGHDLGDCADHITGRAIYVIDLQSGEMIRRFIDFRNLDGQHKPFSADITGSPVLSGANPGDVSSRGFVGDEKGRMFRIDMTDPDPAKWKVQLFFDPAQTTEVVGGLDEGETMGPAAFRPAVTRTPTRQLVLIYGLGQRGDFGAQIDTVQAMIAIEEDFELDNDGEMTISPRPLWGERFEDLERLTGAPVVFDSDVYFTTYVEAEDQCMPGTSRIYRLAYDGIDPLDPTDDSCCEAVGRWHHDLLAESLNQGDILIEGNDPAKWFGPRDPTVIRGMAVTMGPTCELAGDGNSMGTAQQSRRPQMVAQTGSAEVGSADGSSSAPGAAGGGQTGGIGHIAVDLERPRTQSIPLSWSVIEH